MLWHSHVEGEKAIEEQSRGAHQESKGSFHTTHQKQKLITPCHCPCRCVNAKGVLGRPHRCNPALLSSPRSSPLPPPTPRPLRSPIIMATAAPPPAGAPSSSTGGMWLPSVFQPGVAGQTHLVLQVILLSLNAFLFYCAVVGVHRPHYEIMFILSLGLTGSYVWFMIELAKTPLTDAASPSSLAADPAAAAAACPAAAITGGAGAKVASKTE